jgi:hypothetical protein
MSDLFMSFKIKIETTTMEMEGVSVHNYKGMGGFCISFQL